MRRREFLAGLATSPLSLAQISSTAKRDGISISSWSFHNFFPATKDDNAPAPSVPFHALDFPEFIADHYHVHSLEIVAPHFESTAKSYLSDLRARLARAHSAVVNIPADIPELEKGGGLSDKSAAIRNDGIAGCKKWVDVAREIGARSIRCDPGTIDSKDLSPTVQSYKAVAGYGASKGIKILIENHGGVGSEHPEELIRIFRETGANLYALPDFGNFPDETTRMRGLPLLFPYAATVCHAKGLEFDARGNETKFNFERCVQISRKANYRGVYSIEFEGSGDPHPGVQNVVNELLRYL